MELAVHVPWQNVSPNLEVTMGERVRFLTEACQMAKHKHVDSKLPPL